MMEQDYVDFCNQASALTTQAEALFVDISDDHVLQLNGLVRSEIACCPGETVAPGFDFLAAILAQEVERRTRPDKNVFQMPARSHDVQF